MASQSFSLVLTPGCLYTALTTGATPEVASKELGGMRGAAPRPRASSRCISPGAGCISPVSHAAPPASRQGGLGCAQAPGEEPAEVTGALLADNVHDESSSGSQGMLKVRKEFKMGKKKLEVVA